MTPGTWADGFGVGSATVATGTTGPSFRTKPGTALTGVTAGGHGAAQVAAAGFGQGGVFAAGSDTDGLLKEFMTRRDESRVRRTGRTEKRQREFVAMLQGGS